MQDLRYLVLTGGNVVYRLEEVLYRETLTVLLDERPGRRLLSPI